MKLISLLLVLATCAGNLRAQQSLLGNWYAENKTRVYHITQTANGLLAVIKESQRTGDSIGTVKLNNFVKQKQNDYYQVSIYPNRGKRKAHAKLYLSETGNEITLKVRRWYLIPIVITWTRKPNT